MTSYPIIRLIGPYRTATHWVAQYLCWRGDGDMCVLHDPGLFDDAFAPRGLSSGTAIALATLRNPVMRSWSHYNHLLRFGEVKANFQTAVDLYPQILTASFYPTHLKRWRIALGSSRVKVVITDDAQQAISAIDSLLGLEKCDVPAKLLTPINCGVRPSSLTLSRFGRAVRQATKNVPLLPALGRKLGLKRVVFGHSCPLPPMSEEDQAWAYERLAGEVRKLEQVLNCDLSMWKI